MLRGKILYVEGRKVEARAAFATVESGGHFGLEALRGLLVTGAGAESAAKVDVSPSRPVDSAALLTVKAIAAEEHGDLEGARRIRSEVRELVRGRLDSLQRLTADPSAESALETDLSGFWQGLRRARFEEHWREESSRLDRDSAGSFGSSSARSDSPFVAKDGIFYAVWDQARSDTWLQGLVELRSRCEVLAHDAENMPKRPFWKLWGGDDEQRLALSLLVIRLADLRLLLADHLHNFSLVSEDDYGARKLQNVAAGVGELERLFLGAGAKVPEALANLQKTLEYKRGDIVRLVQFVPERSTDPVISLFGNYVDLLADMRSRLGSGTELPKVSAEGPPLLERLRADNQLLTRELSGFIHKAIEPTRRAQVVFFTRVEADNEGSLSRLYGRVGAGAVGNEGKDRK